MDLRPALRRKRAAELTVEALIDVVAEFGSVVGESVGKDYNLNNPRVERFLRGYMADRVDMINSTTREQVKKALASDDPRAAVREVFKHAKERARTIAETEVVRTSNWASIDAGKWVGDLSHKRWASQRDESVRHTHQGLEGQIVEWNAKFTSPSGATAPGPGQFGVAAEDISCRCAAVPSKPGQRRRLEDFGDAVDLFESVRRPHVRNLERSWRRVFREQERAVLDALP